jgi:hypothetical protein
VGEAKPASEQNIPGVHNKQLLNIALPVEFENVPLGHGIGIELFKGQ